MDEEYDVVVLGTGLTECVLSGLLAVNGKKVLHMDRNSYYGGACASLTFEQAWTKFEGEKPIPTHLGSAKEQRKYSIDLVPKFLMANGKLVKLLLHTDVTRYLQFKSVGGSYVLKDRKITKVPATEKEAMGSDLMGFFEKMRFRDFLVFCSEYPKKKSGITRETPTKTLIKKYNLDATTQDVIGHSLCLYKDESWQQRPAGETLDRVKLYVESLRAYGKSPYLYPIFGLGDLPQGFSRLSAIYGGTFMLNKPFEGLEYGEDGKVIGVKSDDGTAKCKFVIGDPSYFPDKVQKTGQVVRCICILDHPIPYTNKADSCQIIFPAGQLKRKNDIYISVVSSTHEVTPAGFFIAIVSTQVETADPKSELQPIINKYVGKVLHQFWSIEDQFSPVEGVKETNVFISNSVDATSHFETISTDVLRLWTEITGETDTSHLLVAKKKE
jgi:Rab GDP dissociation inhibitor